MPSWKEMNVELEKKKHKWYELYNIDYSKSPVWKEFKKQFGKLYDKEKYIYLSQNTLDFNYPLYPDLEEVYGQFGYNMDFEKILIIIDVIDVDILRPEKKII